jgi:hypothetical protein
MRVTAVSLFGWLAGLALAGAAPAQDVQPVVVTNFPPVQAVTGEVKVTGILPAHLASDREVVSPGGPEDVGSLTEGGLIDGTGFTSVVLSLVGEVKGTLTREGRIGALLVPDQPELIKALREEGIVALALRVEARVGPQPTALFASDQPVLRLGFPRYRVFYYNSTPRAAEVKLWAYLTVR